jgi:hypothetical protein
VFIRVNGTIHYGWRAVNQNGHVVDILDKAVALDLLLPIVDKLFETAC